MRGKLKDICESHVTDAGEVKEGVRRMAYELVEFMQDPDFQPRSQSIKEIFEQTTLREHPNLDPETCGDSELAEAVGHSWFPYITKELINKELIPAYEAALNGIDNLVSEVETKRTDFDYIAGVKSLTRLPRVRPGQNYPNAEFGEKTVRVEIAKFGEILNLEKELVLGDQTGKLLGRARDGGEVMGDHRHQFIVQTITDTARTALGEASSTALYYDGAARTLYSNDHSAFMGYTNDNLAASSAIGTAGMDTAYSLMGAMRNEEGGYVTVIPNAVLTHPLKFRTSWQLCTDVTQPDTANRGSNFYAQKLGLVPYQTPYISTNTDWFIGNFAKQVIWMWAWRPKVDSEGATSTASFERDVVARFKYHYSAGCGHRDAKFVIKCTA